MEFSKEIIEIAAYLGAGLSVGIASITTGIATGQIAQEAAYASMRQPRANDRLFSSMLIGQAATGTGGILALVVGLLLLYGGFNTPNGGWFRAAALMAAGLSVGIGSIGPAYGAGYTGGMALKAIGRMPKQSNMIMGNMLIGQALAQADAIFALVVSLLLLFSTPEQPADATSAQIVFQCAAFLGAGLAIGLGTMGPGMGIGYVAGRANDMLGRYPEERANIMRTMFLGAAVSESTAIYALVISFLLIFAV